MDLPNALRALSSSPDLVAIRPSGELIKVTTRQLILTWCRDHWYKWSPKYSDLISIDWEICTTAELERRAQEAKKLTHEIRRAG